MKFTINLLFATHLFHYFSVRIRRKQRRLILCLFVAAVIYTGMDAISTISYRHFLQMESVNCSLKPTGWTYYLSPCKPADGTEGCYIGHSNWYFNGRSSGIEPPITLPFVSSRYEEYGFLWFRKRRYLTPFVRMNWQESDSECILNGQNWR